MSGFGRFVLRAVGDPPAKDFKPGSAVIHLMLLTDTPVEVQRMDRREVKGKHRHQWGGCC